MPQEIRITIQRAADVQGLVTVDWEIKRGAGCMSGFGMPITEAGMRIESAAGNFIRTALQFMKQEEPK